MFSLGHFSFIETISTFIVLFAIIDIIGSIPIIINIKQRGQSISAIKASLISFVLLAGFLYFGELILHIFNVTIGSFAVAGAIIIFMLALEMVLDIEIFKNNGPLKSATLIPLVFPLVAGAGAFTTLLSLRAQYAQINILIALVLNMIWVYVVISLTDKVERIMGQGGIYITRKFFGVILLAIAVKLFADNLPQVFQLS